MALNLARPIALLLWPLLVAAVVWGAVRFARRAPTRSPWIIAALAALRLLLVTLLVLALADPGGRRSAVGDRLVVLVDRSLSLEAADLAAVQSEVASRLASPQTLVVQFASQPELIADPAGPWPDPAGRAATDLGQALRLAGRLLAPEPGELAAGRGEVVLISDGADTGGAALEAAGVLGAAGVPVHVLPVGASPSPDVAVESILAPGAVWSSKEIGLSVNLYASAELTATVRLLREGQLIGERVLPLPAGLTGFDFFDAVAAPGMNIYTVEVSLPGDVRPENNSASAIVTVRPPPAVLIAAHHPAAGEALRAALEQDVMTTTLIAPGGLPVDMAELLRYQVLVLEDVSAQSLSLEQWAAVQAFTQIHGRGLVVAGGRSSYNLGGYETTPLNGMLPVRLETPQRSERPPVALLLIIDSSGSMAPGNYFGPPKIDLAKEAAMRAVEVLQPQDRVGVMSFSDRYSWKVPLTTLGEGLALRDVLDRISTMGASGITRMLTPLQAGILELTQQPTQRKHVVLLSDGQTYEGTPADFEAVVEQAAASGITVSTIALGEPDSVYQELMANIASWGKGRYHFAEAAADIPRLMLAESQSVNSDPLQRGQTQFSLQPHPMLRGFRAADIPPVDGYLALTPRAEADTVLTSGSFGDPVLAAWQYGLGRVVAWTSDVDGDWTRAWVDWEDMPRFWSQVVRYALPDPNLGPLFAAATVTGDQVQVTVLAAGDDGKGINLADGRLIFRAPDTGALARVDLPQTAPGEYGVTFTAPGPGAYRAVAVLESAQGDAEWEAAAGFVVNYPEEFSPRAASGRDLLAAIAQATGGRVLTSLETITPPRAASASVAGYAPWLVLAALILWPVDIALRRRYLPWRTRR